MNKIFMLLAVLLLGCCLSAYASEGNLTYADRPQPRHTVGSQSLSLYEVAGYRTPHPRRHYRHPASHRPPPRYYCHSPPRHHHRPATHRPPHRRPGAHRYYDHRCPRRSW